MALIRDVWIGQLSRVLMMAVPGIRSIHLVALPMARIGTSSNWKGRHGLTSTSVMQQIQQMGSVTFARFVSTIMIMY
ncbi:hypothetical protein D3C86_2140190 [compost metagenome]